MGIALIIVVFICGGFSFYQSERSAAIMASFKDFIPPKATVIRNSNTQQINAADLVPGDIVKISSGGRIPADIRILESIEMKVDNSSLTGESEPQPRKKDNTKDNILEAENMAYFGTTCVDGKGTGLVVLTGENTVMGGIAELASSAEAGETPLIADMRRFTKIITIIASTAGVIFIIYGIIIRFPAVHVIVSAIGIIVANVPEGLPITLTVALAFSAQKLATKKVLAKNLISVETLGSTSCICTDKTGTLTQNSMAPAHALISGKMYDCSMSQDEYEKKTKSGQQAQDPGYHEPPFRKFVEYMALSSVGEILDPSEQEIKEQIAKQLSLKSPKDVSNEKFSQNKDSAKETLQREKPFRKRKVSLGNPTEAGIIRFIAPLINLKEVRNQYAKVFEIPFKSANKYNLTVRRIHKEGSQSKEFSHHLLIMKGASEKIIERSDKIFVENEVKPISDDIRKDLEQKNKELASKGERVLGLSYLELDANKWPDKSFEGKKGKEEGKEEGKDSNSVPNTGLIFLGLISLYDPPRENVEKSVDKCKGAGIKVIMVTGDQPETAKAIANQCHIISDLSQEYGNMMAAGMPKDEAFKKSKAIVIHGDELLHLHKEDAKLPPEDPEKGLYLKQWLSKKEIVFARLNPAQKLIIARACQELGYVVAVTGDGVNDTPAIEQANIGIAMGSGSDVAKDAADMVLLNDDFTSIAIGVEEGRLIFVNMKKAIAYSLTSNFPRIIPFMIFIFFQIPQPITTIEMLLIDLGSDLWPAISFAYEQPEHDLMEQKPRNPKRDKLVNFNLLSFVYPQMGLIQVFAVMFTYYSVLKDYGFYPMHLWFFLFKKGCVNNGNLRFYDWSTSRDGGITMQEFYVNCSKIAGTERARPDYYVPISQTLDTISSISGKPVRYTSEALKYAQTSAFLAIIVCQWATRIVCRTRRANIWNQPFTKLSLLYGLLFETAVGVACTYVPFLNIAFRTRPVTPRHLFVNAFPFFFILIIYDELRRYVMMKRSRFEKGKKPKYSWLYRYTYY